MTLEVSKRTAAKSPNKKTQKVNATSNKSTGVAASDSGELPCKKSGKKKSSKSLPVLVAIKPLNLAEEKKKFFERKYEYDPQFCYTEDSEAEQAQASYGQPSDKYIPQAVRIIERALERYGTYSDYEFKSGGDVMSREEVLTYVSKYLEKQGMTTEIRVNITPNLISYASMTRVKGIPTINIKSGTTRKNWIEGMLNHEIGTHYIRSYNQKLQPWKSRKQRRRLRLLPANPTEEGLASINTHIYREKPVLLRSALTYLTVYLASKLSFSQTFERLAEYIDNPDTRWSYVMRAKRGQIDTSQPGCFAKDQIYLTGALEILSVRHTLDFECLYRCGKVSYKDLGKLLDKTVQEETRLPYFLSDRHEYVRRLDKIVEFNGLIDSDFV